MKSRNYFILRNLYLFAFLLAFSASAQTTKLPISTETQTNKIAGWYEHRSKDFRIPLFDGWTWKPDIIRKNFDLIMSPDEEIVIFVEEGFLELTDESDEAALNRLANTAVEETSNSTVTPAKVGNAEAVRINVYEQEENFPIWVYYFVHERRVYYLFIVAAPDSGNIGFPQTLTEMLNKVEFLRIDGQLKSQSK